MFEQVEPGVWLVVGPHDLRSEVGRPDAWQVLLLECPPDLLTPTVDGSQLYRVPLTGWSPARAIVLDERGDLVRDSRTTPDEVLADLTMMPLGLLRPAPGDHVRVYAHVDRYLQHARFLRLPGEPVPAANAIQALLAGTDEHFLKVCNYLCFRVKLLPDVELEHKYTLTSQPDVHRLALETIRWAAEGGLAGWVVEFREEIQSWDFLNHVYAIEQPAADAGYVSFIPTTDGRHTVKRKLFTVDTDERPELRSRGVEVDVDFETHIRQTMGLEPTWHASFRRIRYDVSVESIDTGNVFGIAYDRCTIIDDEGKPVPGLDELVQCEIEYIYSQSLAPIGFDSVRDDLAQLRVLVGDWFAERSITNYQTHESKLTFLRNQYATLV